MEILKNKIVLIVDDEEANVFALKNYLKTFEMEVVTAYDGFAAIELLHRGPKPDIILLDIMMPVMDGYETLSVLQNDQNYNRIPVIAVTAKAMTGDKQKCLEAGAWDYISKPLDLKALVEKMNTQLR